MNEVKEKPKRNNLIITYPDIEKDRMANSTINNSSKKSSNKKRNIIIVTSSILSIFIISLFVLIMINLQSKNIFSNIYIDGINVSGLSKEEAIIKVKEEKSTFLNKSITLNCDNISLDISGKDIDANYNVEKSVDEAYSVGRYGNIISNNVSMIMSNFDRTDISCDYNYDTEKLDLILNSVTNNLPQLEQSTYAVQDDNLVITTGKPGVFIDEDAVKEKVISALQDNTENTLQIPYKVISPDAIDIEKIHNEIYKEPVDASYKTDPYEIIPHQLGVDFSISLQDAQNMIAEAKSEYIIPLVYKKPSVTTDQIGTEAFPDLLASFDTQYIQSKLGRTNNLRVATNSINGVVIMPGETFSYNKTLGPRTVAAGYQLAGVYSGGEEVEGLGGGICQISSNLYNIALMANLEIVERHNHQFLPGYVGAGRDATVAYGSLDFQFKNTRNYPIKIQAYVNNGWCGAKLYGIKENNEYEVSFVTNIISTVYPQEVYLNTSDLAEGETKVQSSGQNGCISETYKILKQNGVEVSRTKLSYDRYDAKKKVILRGTSHYEAPEPEAELEPAKTNTNTNTTSHSDNNSKKNVDNTIEN